MARRRISPFNLAFLDAMTCGFGAVVLLYMVINAGAGLRAGKLTGDLRAEVERLEEQVLEQYKNLVVLRNTARQTNEDLVTARGLSRRVIEQIRQIRLELATYDASTLARSEHVNRLKTDLQTIEREARRLSAAAPSEQMPGDRTRSFVGDGDRQYLTGLKVGGRRIFILVDASASMLDDTLVNVLRRRNLPDEVKIRADKWQQAVSTVDWLTTQIPRDSRFQLYVFSEQARPVVSESEGQWLAGDDRRVLDEAVEGLREVVPGGGTNLHRGFEALRTLRPAPDNVILLVDGLPTLGQSPPRGRTISGKQRLRLFNRALETLLRGVPINVILFPMEGDPMAPGAYWELARVTHGSYMSPSEDWP